MLDELPFPDLELIHGYENMKTMPIMTSWGCPFHCNFCSVTAMFGRKYRFRSAENIIAELKQRKPRKIFFYDDNLAADKKRLKELCQRMLDEDIVVPWSAQMRTDVVRDPELLDLMHRTGCFRAYLGLESVNQETLDAFDKHQSVDDIVQAIRILHEHGIESHGMFVLGADTDTMQSVRETVKFAMKNHIDTIQLAALTPLPGTPLYDELDAAGRIFEKQLVPLRRPARGLRAGQHDPLRAAARGAARLHEVLLAERQWAKYFFTFRFTKLLFQTWGWWIVRTWRKNKANQAFMQSLRKLPRPRPQAVAQASEAKH